MFKYHVMLRYGMVKSFYQSLEAVKQLFELSEREEITVYAIPDPSLSYMAVAVKCNKCGEWYGDTEPSKLLQQVRQHLLEHNITI
jgi:hypothetical protein